MIIIKLNSHKSKIVSMKHICDFYQFCQNCKHLFLSTYLQTLIKKIVATDFR